MDDIEPQVPNITWKVKTIPKTLSRPKTNSHILDQKEMCNEY
jgi:hypothetical protein